MLAGVGFPTSNNMCWQVLVMLLNVGSVGKTNMCWGKQHK